MRNNNFPEILYHYCSLDAFISIIQNRCFWLSDSRYTNDALEIAALREVVIRALNDLVNDRVLSSEEAERFWSTFINNTLMGYISCFSENGDLLSQWRAYGNDGEGVSIGVDFNSMDLEIGGPFMFAGPEKRYFANKVIYADDSFKESIINFIKLKHDLQKDFDQIHQMFRLSYYTKTIGFKEECEWRIIFMPPIFFDDKTGEVIEKTSLWLQDSKYRVKGNKIISYFELPFKKDVIKEIIIGPKNTSDMETISMLLVKNGFKGIKLKRSSIPYV